MRELQRWHGVNGQAMMEPICSLVGTLPDFRLMGDIGDLCVDSKWRYPGNDFVTRIGGIHDDRTLGFCSEARSAKY